MKWFMLAFLITIPLSGMDRLIDYARMAYQYDLPTESLRWDINQIFHGMTMLDHIWASRGMERDFVEFLRQRGARRMQELPAQSSPELMRALCLVNHIVPGRSS